MGDRITVVLAEDHEVVRKGLRSELTSAGDIEIVGEAADGTELSSIVRSAHPMVVIVDYVMPGGGVSLIRELANNYPEANIVVFSLYDNKAYVIGSLEAGAKAYVLKEASIDELIHAIREVAIGRRYLSTKLSQMAIDAFVHNTYQETNLYSTLTPREKEVLKLVTEGFSNIDIARKLEISKRTVEIHRANLMRKLNLRPQYVQLADFAREHGILHESNDTSTDLNDIPNS